ncbi:hypothetical protein NADFUDRAFT_53268 [Nadsonia fulvescens var. elongata DSM 6958]|uniref:Cytochrome c oxidase assembly protein COX19 n=1 Tax=Nadsonia fulvescens var. elongata DSM 6958 TaxID=857566 RepID=A0A1E3PDW6_9ASCO|nr:hypothetical protein NADFUDRAFT_53268 [Nadsonia fulvescens var. elongata DSM 6958]
MNGPGSSTAWRPTPPQRGSFPLDHDSECSHIMADYLKCLNSTRGTNAPTCRLLAKRYLSCRMDTGLMGQDEWKNLGLPDDDKNTTDATTTTKIVPSTSPAAVASSVTPAKPTVSK